MADLESLKGKETAPGNERRMAELLVSFGNLCLTTGDFDEGIGSFKKAVRFAKPSDYKLKEAEAYLGIGHILEKENKWDEAIDYLNRGLKLSEEIDYPLGMAAASRWLAHLNWHKSQYDESLKWLDKSMENAKRTGDSGILGMTLIEFGLIYSDRGELERANEYLKDSIPLLEGARDYKQVARVYNNLGDAAMQSEEWEKAIEYFEKCGEAAGMINNQEMMAWGFFNSAEALVNIGEVDEALERGQNALDILKPIGEIVGIQGSYRVLALGNSAKKNWDEAVKYFEKSFEALEGRDSKYHTGQIYYDWGRMYIAKGDKKRAKKLFLQAKEQLEPIGAKILLNKTENALEDL